MLKNKTKTIYGFMHVGLMNNCREIFESQLKLLKLSKLFKASKKIYVCLAGQQKFNCPDNMEIGVWNKRLYEGEIRTMEFIHQKAKEINEPCSFWYIHTKGARWEKGTYQSNCAETWRKYMEYFIIEKWETCQRKLSKYDTCGIEYHTKNNKWTYSGNFWWARSDYIAKIKNPICQAHENIHEDEDDISSIRYRAELFLSQGFRPKICNLFTLNLGGDLYSKNILRNWYTKDPVLNDYKIKLN